MDDQPSIEQPLTEQPPVDNVFVAAGCEMFADSDNFASLKPPTREEFLNTIAELELRIEKLEATMIKVKSGLPQIPW